jgi:hypothetical protein
MAPQASKRATDLPTPQDFGARGDGVYDDTEAIQAAVDSVKKNAVWRSPQGSASRGVVRLPPGRYRITRSLDLTSGGDVAGVGLRGDSMMNSIVLADLDEPYPAVDLSGMAYATLERCQIRGTTRSEACAAALIAQPADSKFHNRQTSLRDCVLAVDGSAASAIAGLIVQNGDLLRTENVHCEGPVAASVGRYLPSLGKLKGFLDVRGLLHLSGEATQAAVEQASGKAISVSVGRSTHVSYVAEASWPDRILQLAATSPLSGPCDATLWAVRSKFRAIPAAPDQTNYWISKSEFYGRTPIVWRGGLCLNLSDCYLCGGGPAGTFGLDAVRSAFHLTDTGQDFPLVFRARNVRTENQTDELEFYALTTDTSVDLCEIAGEFEVVPRNSEDTAGAVIRARNGARLVGVIMSGFSSGRVPMFAGVAEVRSLAGSYRADGGPGSLRAVVRGSTFDWLNPNLDTNWATVSFGRPLE